MRQSLAALTLVTAVLLGCGKMKKTSECNTFIDKVNTSLQEIQKHTNSGSDKAQNIAAMKKVGDLYDKLGSEVSALDISTDELKKFATEYQAMCTKAAGAAKNVASALETDDVGKAEAASKEFDAVEKQEDALVDNINKFCQAQ